MVDADISPAAAGVKPGKRLARIASPSTTGPLMAIHGIEAKTPGSRYVWIRRRTGAMSIPNARRVYALKESSALALVGGSFGEPSARRRRKGRTAQSPLSRS
jgi:hypothetical protein